MSKRVTVFLFTFLLAASAHAQDWRVFGRGAVDEDKVIGVYQLNIKPENVRIVPVDEVFSK